MRPVTRKNFAFSTPVGSLEQASAGVPKMRMFWTSCLMCSARGSDAQMRSSTRVATRMSIHTAALVCIQTRPSRSSLAVRGPSVPGEISRACLAVGSHPLEILSLRTSANLFLERVSVECVRRVASVCSPLQNPNVPSGRNHQRSPFFRFRRSKVCSQSASEAWCSQSHHWRPGLQRERQDHLCRRATHLPVQKMCNVDATTRHQPDNSIPCCRACKKHCASRCIISALEHDTLVICCSVEVFAVSVCTTSDAWTLLVDAS